jgi:hypothetical protein
LVFFASGASSGASAQPEILGLMAPEKTQDLSAAIARSSEHVREEKFKHRIESAELVVTGEVTRVAAKEGRAEGKDKDDRDKDKDDWNVATVQISRVLKGHHSNKTVNVVFPQGTAARWVGTPRFEVGDKGIWILRREHEDENYRAAGFQDFLLLGDLSWVEKLLK